MVAHGFGWAGDLYLPSAEEFAWISGTQLGALNFDNSPAAPQDSAHVAPEFDRVSVNILLGEFLGAPGHPGAYQETNTAPDGQTWTFTGEPGKGVQFWVYGKDKPGGDWVFRHVSGGGGFAATEGVAYHANLVEMPGGTLRVAPAIVDGPG